MVSHVPALSMGIPTRSNLKAVAYREQNGDTILFISHNVLLGSTRSSRRRIVSGTWKEEEPVRRPQK